MGNFNLKVVNFTFVVHEFFKFILFDLVKKKCICMYTQTKEMFILT
jgi:hypothetical protein